jgi:hypothetical protein
MLTAGRTPLLPCRNAMGHRIAWTLRYPHTGDSVYGEYRLADRAVSRP